MRTGVTRGTSFTAIVAFPSGLLLERVRTVPVWKYTGATSSSSEVERSRSRTPSARIARPWSDTSLQGRRPMGMMAPMARLTPWTAKAVILTATVVMIAIRAPHGRRSRIVKVVRSGKSTTETVLLILAWLGFLLPLVWIVSPVFSFADYRLRTSALMAGTICLGIGLWFFYRSHADLGTNWSV